MRTPGTWHLKKYEDDLTDCDGNTQRVEICRVESSDGTTVVSDDYGLSEDNLRLMAAAPEMFELLEVLHADLCERDVFPGRSCEICRVLAKAEGKSVDYDPTPYCHGGHVGPKDCDCGPIAENE